MTSVQHELRQALEDWTGFPYAVFVHSGSAALSLGLDLLVPIAGRIALPAIACWTLTGAVMRSGRIPIWKDIGDDLCLDGPPCNADALIHVAPWGNTSAWERFSDFRGIKIADLTHVPHGGRPAEAASHFHAAVISLGEGKPWNVGAGGILLLRDHHLSREAQVHLSYGRQRQRWSLNTDRYVFASSLFSKAYETWCLLAPKAAAHGDKRRQWQTEAQQAKARFTPTVLGDAAPGATTLVPHLLDQDFPLSGEEISLVAMAEGIPLGSQPVSPAYLEPAVAAHLNGPICRALTAEVLYRRLFFVPEKSLNCEVLGRMNAFLKVLEQDPGSFSYPYAPQAAPIQIPDSLSYWLENAVVARRLDGTYCVYDPFTSKRHIVPDGVAATLLAGPPQQFRLAYEIV